MPQGALRSSDRGTARGAFGMGDVFALTTVILWGTSFTVIKSAYHEFTPLAFAAVRFVIASLGLLLILGARGQVPGLSGATCCASPPSACSTSASINSSLASDCS